MTTEIYLYQYTRYKKLYVTPSIELAFRRRTEGCINAIANTGIYTIWQE